MSEAARYGIKPSEFWQMTPAELILFIEANQSLELDQFKQAITCAWLCAAYQRSKRLPDLDEVMKKLEYKEPEPMTSDDIFNQIKALNGALGGEVIE